MDLTTGWDFRVESHREKATRYIEEKKPTLLIGPPMCTMFSRLQNLTPWNEDRRRRWGEARQHMKFVTKLCETQMDSGSCARHNMSTRPELARGI